MLPNMEDWARFGVQTIVAMWLISSFVTDLLIAVTLVWDLVSRKFLSKYLYPFLNWSWKAPEKDGIPVSGYLGKQMDQRSAVTTLAIIQR